MFFDYLKKNFNKKNVFIVIIVALISILLFIFSSHLSKFIFSNNFLGDTGSYDGDSSYDGSGGYDLSPICGTGYGQSKQCQTGVPNQLCVFGFPRNLDFQSVRGEKNLWTWNCELEQEAVQCSAIDKSRCVIIAIEGYNGTGEFNSRISKIADSYKCRDKYRSISIEKLNSEKNNGLELIKKIDEKIVQYNGNEDQNEKILVVGHSLGALSAFLVKIASGNDTDVDYLLYDPPYDFPFSDFAKLAPDFLENNIVDIKNGVLIEYARENGLNADYPGVINWTNGFDQKRNTPDSQPDSVLHDSYLYNESALNDVNKWIEGNCKVE